MLSWICAMIVLAVSFWLEPQSVKLVRFGAIQVGMYLDVLSGIMLSLVTFLGAVVTRYSVNYLRGDPRQKHFSTWLGLTLCSVMWLVISNNLLMFTCAWMATSLSLHQLLIFYKDRRSGLIAAKKKFIISRIGDACLTGALILTWKCFGTWDFADLFVQAQRIDLSATQDSCATWISVLLVAGAALKSAQFPFHSWLPDTMETPTPVSALMHAGIINAGGFLIIRLSPLIVLSPSAMSALMLLGSFTALFASVVMMTQTSVKKTLAWSTISQMGFMMLQCGLGAFALAALHMVAHSLYKAHAFLSSGSLVDQTRTLGGLGIKPGANPWLLLSAICTTAVTCVWLLALTGISVHLGQGDFLLIGVFILAVAHLLGSLWNAPSRLYLIPWGIAITGILSLLGFGFHALFREILKGTLPEYSPHFSTAEFAAMSVIGALFLGLLILQWQSSFGIPQRWLFKLYVHAHNGLYIGTWAERVFGK